MKFSSYQMASHLKNKLLPVYLICGNELLLVEEIRELILQKAQQEGFSETQRYVVNKDFDWQHLRITASNLSLFSAQSCLELKLTHKLNAAASKALTELIEHLPADKFLVILSEKLDTTAQKSTWFQAINKIGGIITLWPLDTLQFAQWIKRRLEQKNLTVDPPGFQLLVEQTQGNLLAGAQEIEKLQLLFANKPIRYEDMVAVITDNTHYMLFDFIDIFLQANANKTIKVLRKLRGEGIEPPLLLHVLTKEIRNLIHILQDSHHISWGSITKKYQIWEKRQNLIKKTIQQHSLKDFHKLLKQAEKIDQTIKGLLPGNIWDQFELLVLNINHLPNLA